MATARDLCRKILEATGTVGLRQPIEGAQLEDTLEYLNMELTVLNNQNSFTPYERVYETTITGGSDEYTIGVGGDIDLPRPISISWMKVLDGGSWFDMNQTSQKNFGQYTILDGGEIVPRYFYYESTFPLGVIGFGRPVSNTRQLKIAIRHEIPAFGLNDEVDLPEGYYPLLLWGTTSRLPDIPSIKRTEAKANYNEMLMVIKSQNTKAPRLRSSFRTNKKYDMRTDTNR